MQPGAKITRMPDLSGNVEKSQFAMRHFTVQEVASLWNLSDDIVRELFEREPGVLVIGRDRSTRKRRYLTLRIPQDVVERVYRQRQRP
jgi:hypothetical protein